MSCDRPSIPFWGGQSCYKFASSTKRRRHKPSPHSECIAKWTELIEDLLDVSRILQGKLSLNATAINLASTIRSAIKTVPAGLAKSIGIEVSLNYNVGYVSGDSTRLQQVVWNLLSNAVKFTPAGGRVEVRLEQVGNQAQITISDNGKGIPQDFLPHVFDYFRQADGATTRKFGDWD